MPKSRHRDALLRVVELINNPIIAKDEFAQSLDLEFRNDPADTRMSRDRAGATNKLAGNAQCRIRIIARDVFVDLGEIRIRDPR